VKDILWGFLFVLGFALGVGAYARQHELTRGDPETNLLEALILGLAALAGASIALGIVGMAGLLWD
jgi:hypothetical protein